MTTLQEAFDRDDPAFWLRLLEDASRNAINEYKALDIPITFLQDGWIVNRHPDGSIEKLSPLTIRLKGRTIPLELAHIFHKKAPRILKRDKTKPKCHMPTIKLKQRLLKEELKKLKTITLEMIEEPAHKFNYTTIDTDGKLLSTRAATRSCNGTTFIAALVTKNNNQHKYRYSVFTLYSTFERIGINDRPADKRSKPYAIAVLEEHKEAYEQWLNDLNGNICQDK